MSGLGYSVNLTKQYLIVLSRVILGDQHYKMSEKTNLPSLSFSAGELRALFNTRPN